MTWLANRFKSLLAANPRFAPRERRVLLALAWLRAALTAGAAIAVWHVAPRPWAYGLCLLAAPIAAIGSADFVENRLRKLLLGYAFNPRVSAIGEWEGWNGPTEGRDRERRLWEAHKYDVLYYREPGDIYLPALWEGDPGSGRFGDE